MQDSLEVTSHSMSSKIQSIKAQNHAVYKRTEHAPLCILKQFCKQPLLWVRVPSNVSG